MVGGRVEAILVSERATQLPAPVQHAVAVPGTGLEGDRYARGAGTFSDGPPDGRALTLVEAEVLEELGIDFASARRNVVTRGIRLNPLVGRRFTIGGVLCEGRRLCEPCAHLERVTGRDVLRALAGRGGLRADILVGGELAAGAALDVLD